MEEACRDGGVASLQRVERHDQGEEEGLPTCPSAWLLALGACSRSGHVPPVPGPQETPVRCPWIEEMICVVGDTSDSPSLVNSTLFPSGLIISSSTQAPSALASIILRFTLGN